MNVRWGITASSVLNLAGVAENGFDWFNLPLSLLMEMNDEQFIKFVNNAKKNGFGFDICTLDLPQDVVITQKGFNVYVWMEYLKKAIERLTELGCRGIVWSNGQARILPEEGDVMGAKEQVAQFLFLLCELTSQHGINILVEPLGPEYTNFLNTLEETSDFLGLIAMDNIFISLSARKSPLESFEVEELEKYKDSIQLIKLNGDHSIEARGNEQILNNLSMSSCTPSLLLPEGADHSFLVDCKKILRN